MDYLVDIVVLGYSFLKSFSLPWIIGVGCSWGSVDGICVCVCECVFFGGIQLLPIFPGV